MYYYIISFKTIFIGNPAFLFRPSNRRFFFVLVYFCIAHGIDILDLEDKLLCFGIQIYKHKDISLTLYHTIPTFNDPKEEGFGKHCRKKRNAGLLFPQCFRIYHGEKSPF